DLPELGLALRRGHQAGGLLPPWAPRCSASQVPISSDGTVVVRSRRPGDRIHTRGGTQSVAAAMIAARVPRVARDLVPVVEDAQGLLWVPGVAVRAGAQGEMRLRLVARRLP
ncbi:MAG: tRNA lysidine(34) synthetase TilS, partial [Chloroflexota bacterium]|nr:tRNA lysidine(34) synthetase TilS [Chloroflexota bacterium]